MKTGLEKEGGDGGEFMLVVLFLLGYEGVPEADLPPRRGARGAARRVATVAAMVAVVVAFSRASNI